MKKLLFITVVLFTGIFLFCLAFESRPRVARRDCPPMRVKEGFEGLAVAVAMGIVVLGIAFALKLFL